ncbi:MAG: hypothetical protein Q8Q44_03710, partial [Nocardioides sp.]|nr:hypothetical protein [Nocardioides sp.]
VTRCLASGSLTSAACTKVLADANLLDLLVKECRKNANKDKVVCVLLGGLPLAGGGSGSGLVPGLGGLLGGLNLRQSLTSGTPDQTSGVGLFGEGLR